jgi:hypothetical protein
MAWPFKHEKTVTTFLLLRRMYAYCQYGLTPSPPFHHGLTPMVDEGVPNIIFRALSIYRHLFQIHLATMGLHPWLQDVALAGLGALC